MKTRKWSLPILMIGFSLILPACSSAQRFERLDADAVTSLGETCQALYQRHVEAWDSRDPENFRQIYTDDILAIDGDPSDAGVDGLIDIGDAMFVVFPDWQMKAGDTYVSGDQCLGTWLNWGMLGFSQEDPGYEYDVIEAQDQKISYWRAFYDQNFHEAVNHADLVVDEFLENYASTWSSGDLESILQRYAEDATLEDTLFGFSIAGQEGIRDYASRFMATGPGASWEMGHSFAESLANYPYKDEHPFPSQGAVYTIHLKGRFGNPCDVQTVVILTPNEEGLIQSQQVFYEADTLVACGWAK